MTLKISAMLYDENGINHAIISMLFEQFKERKYGMS